MLAHPEGRLTLLEAAPSRGRHRYRHAVCACGTRLVTRLDNAVARPTSCGCAKRDLTAEHRRILALTGQPRTPTYWAWVAVIERRVLGAVVEPRWLDLEQGLARFVDDLGERPEGRSLRRRDADGPYTAANLRWL